MPNVIVGNTQLLQVLGVSTQQWSRPEVIGGATGWGGIRWPCRRRGSNRKTRNIAPGCYKLSTARIPWLFTDRPVYVKAQSFEFAVPFEQCATDLISLFRALTFNEKWIIERICVIRTNQMHFSLLIYFNNHPLHVSNGLTIHHQGVLYCIYSVWYFSYIYGVRWLAASTIRVEAQSTGYQTNQTELLRFSQRRCWEVAVKIHIFWEVMMCQWVCLSGHFERS
jgi:hypothetical protein